MLERGGFWLPVHCQMLPVAFNATTSSPPTTYPWSRTKEMATTGEEFFQAGYIPIVGGRMSYWSAWCPAPEPDQMRDWPEELVAVTQQPGFWERAKKFLHVTSMDQINDGVYGKLQEQLDTALDANFEKFVPTAEHAYPAPIAVDIPSWKSVKFFKFSTVGTLARSVRRTPTTGFVGTLRRIRRPMSPSSSALGRKTWSSGMYSTRRPTRRSRR